jgi:hypothetical protein
MDRDLDAATKLCVVSILKGLCHLNDVRVDQRHAHSSGYLYREDDMAKKAKKAKKAAATQKVAKKTSAKKKK